MKRHLKFPNAVVLNTVGRRKMQMSAKERERAQTHIHKSTQKSAKARQNCKQPGLKQPGGIPRSKVRNNQAKWELPKARESQKGKELSAPKIAVIFAICDCDAHRGPQKSIAISEKTKKLLLRWKVASDLRF